MLVSEFDFDLPPELIAQEPPAERGASRLHRLGREDGAISHHRFSDLPDLLAPGDLLVVNDTRVFPARRRRVLRWPMACDDVSPPMPRREK